MRRVLASVLLLCASALPVAAAPLSFSASLSGSAEEPANASPGTGVTVVTIDPEAHTMRVQVAFSGLQGVTTAAHIHVVGSFNDTNLLDTVGPVFTTTPTFPGFPNGVTAATYDQTFNTLAAGTYNPALLNNPAIANSVAAAEQALFAGILSGNAYLNVHSSVFPGGEIRGFLDPVPEPASVALLGIGVVALLSGRRRQPRRAAR